jgi:acetyl-CoA carboxylase carboxyltransferase component
VYAKRQIKIQQIVRWRTAGIADTRIQVLLGLSPGGLSAILALQEYKDAEADYLAGFLGQMDEALSGKVNEIRKNFQIAVPAAMRALVDAVTQRKDLRASLEAAKEILDRDPDHTLPKSKDEQAAPGVPAEILQAAVEVGNGVANNYDKGKVN